MATCIHEHEKEDSGVEEARQQRIVGHEQRQKCGHLLHEDRIESQQQLDDVRQRAAVAQRLFNARKRPDDRVIGVAARIVFTDADQDVEDQCGQIALVQQRRSRRQQRPAEDRYVLHRLPAVESLRPAPAFPVHGTLCDHYNLILVMFVHVIHFLN